MSQVYFSVPSDTSVTWEIRRMLETFQIQKQYVMIMTFETLYNHKLYICHKRMKNSHFGDAVHGNLNVTLVQGNQHNYTGCGTQGEKAQYLPYYLD